MEFSALIFDFDGTIIDTEWSQFVTVREEFRRFGHDYVLEDFQNKVGRADQRHWSDELLDLIGPNEEIEQIRGRRQQAHADMIASTEVQPGVVDLLNKAEQQGLSLGIASSSPISWVGEHLITRGLHDRFSMIATRDIVEQAKPWPDVFLAAAEGLAVEPSRCLAIEDSHHGVAAAKAAGMTCVAVPNRVTATSDLTAADLVLDSLLDFPFSDFGL